MLFSINGPASTILILIALAISQGSDEPAHPCSLVRSFAARTYKVWKYKKDKYSRNKNINFPYNSQSIKVFLVIIQTPVI